MRGRDERAHFGVGIMLCAGLDLGHSACGFRHHPVINRFLDHDAAWLRAILSGIEICTTMDGFDDRIDIGVAEHDHGRLAAEFQMHMANLLRGGLHRRHPGGRRAGDRNPLDARIVDQAVADPGAVTVNDVEHTGGENAIQDLGKPQGRQRRHLRRLQYHRASGGKRRSELP